MSWFRLDDQGAFHSKVLAAGNEAYGAWCRAGQWCAAHGTDGQIPRHVAAQIAPPRIWKRLISVKLLDEIRSENDPFFIHDFLDYNPSKASLDERRQVRAAVGSIGGKRRVLNETVKQKLEQTSSKNSSKNQDDATVLLEPCLNPRPVPSRPVPERTDPEGEPPVVPHGGTTNSEQPLELPFGPTIAATNAKPKSKAKAGKVERSDEQKAAHVAVVEFWCETFKAEKQVDRVIITGHHGKEIYQLLELVQFDVVQATELIRNAFTHVFFREKRPCIAAILREPNTYRKPAQSTQRPGYGGQVAPTAAYWNDRDKELSMEHS